MAAILLFIGYVGPFLIDHDNARLGAATPRQAPSAAHFFGTDVQGRDLWTWWVLGMGQTLKVAFIAGFLGTGAGLVLGLAGRLLQRAAGLDRQDRQRRRDHHPGHRRPRARGRRGPGDDASS